MSSLNKKNFTFISPIIVQSQATLLKNLLQLLPTHTQPMAAKLIFRCLYPKRAETRKYFPIDFHCSILLFCASHNS